ncbi:unnamed protein product, partial [Closterium sp. NIES-54]
MIHAAAPHFLWPFAVRYAAHQLNLWPRVSLPETSPTLRWMGKVGDASVFWVRGTRAFVRDTSADKLSSRTIPCVFLGFLPDAPGWQFYHPTSRRVLPLRTSRLTSWFPFTVSSPTALPLSPPPSLFLAPGPPPVDPLPPQGPAPSSVSKEDPLPGTVPVEVAVDSGAARGAACLGAASGGSEPARVEPGGAEPEGAEPRGAESEGAESGGAEPGGAELGAVGRGRLRHIRRAFVRDTSADKLSSRTIPCVFLGFLPDAPGWQFYHPTSRRVLPSQDITFDKLVPFYRLFPYRTAPLPPP